MLIKHYFSKTNFNIILPPTLNFMAQTVLLEKLTITQCYSLGFLKLCKHSTVKTKRSIHLILLDLIILPILGKMHEL